MAVGNPMRRYALDVLKGECAPEGFVEFNISLMHNNICKTVRAAQKSTQSLIDATVS